MMNKQTKGFLVAAVLICAIASGGCGKKTPATSPPPSPTGTASTAPSPSASAPAAGGTVDAQTIYKANCISCHGDNLEGKLGPNTNISKIGSKLSKDKIVNQISNGGGGMMAFKGKLKDNEIDALADWLAAKK